MSESLVILTPTFGRSGSGAATYYGLLVDLLSPHFDTITVVSERGVPQGAGAGAAGYVGLWPQRSSRDKQPLRDVLKYGVQNLQYTMLPQILKRQEATCLLLHSSFFNWPGILPVVLRSLSAHRRAGLRVVADVRDGLLPPKRVPLLNDFDAVIACSDNVEAHLLAHGADRQRIRPIPVVQEPLSAAAVSSPELLSSLGLGGAPYVFYAGLLKESKAVDLLLDAFLNHVRPLRPDLKLVLSGLLKTRHAGIRADLTREGVQHVGNRGRAEVLALMAGAALCVNLSPIEGLPRSSLEALALGRPTLLPPRVPEFARHCPERVVESRDASEVGAMMLDALERGDAPNYPIARHAPAATLPLYLDVLAPCRNASAGSDRGVVSASPDTGAGS